MADKNKTTSTPKGDYAIAVQTAHILGDSSAAAQALVDFRQREAAGESPVIVRSLNSWLVVPLSDYERSATPKGDYAIAVQSAHILGDSSAAAQALADFRQRETAGESPVIVRSLNSWLVVPLSDYESSATPSRTL